DEVADLERKLFTESSGSDSGEQRQRQRQWQWKEAATAERNVDGGITSKVRVEEVASRRWEADIGVLVGSIEPTNANAIEPDLKT
ncbi:hypothetical protein BHE74_00022054, partial [Ensete ventricosum]